MKQGGYIVVDFQKVFIDDVTGASLDGIYDRVKACVGGKKATLVSGLNNDGTIVEDFYTKFVKRSTDYYGLISFENSVATYIKVESDDDISIITAEIQGGGSDFDPYKISITASGIPTKDESSLSWSYTHTGINDAISDYYDLVIEQSKFLPLYIEGVFATQGVWGNVMMSNQFPEQFKVVNGESGTMEMYVRVLLTTIGDNTVTALADAKVTIGSDDAVTFTVIAA